MRHWYIVQWCNFIPSFDPRVPRVLTSTVPPPTLHAPALGGSIPLPCLGAGTVMCLPLAGSRPVYPLGWYSTAATNAAPCPLPSFTMIIVVCRRKPSTCHRWYKIYQYAFFWNSRLTEEHSIKISISQRIIKSCFSKWLILHGIG